MKAIGGEATNRRADDLLPRGREAHVVHEKDEGPGSDVHRKAVDGHRARRGRLVGPRFGSFPEIEGLKGGYGLRSAIFDDCEVLRLQATYGPVAAVDHDRVYGDELNLRLEAWDVATLLHAAACGEGPEWSGWAREGDCRSRVRADGETQDQKRELKSASHGPLSPEEV